MIWLIYTGEKKARGCLFLVNRLIVSLRSSSQSTTGFQESRRSTWSSLSKLTSPLIHTSNMFSIQAFTHSPYLLQ